jgi:cephalosporin hydroxylase
LRRWLSIIAAVSFGLVLGCGEAGNSGAADPQAGKRVLDPHAGNRALYDPNAPFPKLSPEETSRAIKDMHHLWRQRKAIFRSRFLGVHTEQNPTDAWIVQEIISEVKPDLIVETGTFRGGSSLLWATILEQVNPEGRVVTIDIVDQRTPRAKTLPISRERVDFLLGSSTDPEVVAEVHRRAEGLRVLVLLDSLHTAEHVANELAAYAPLVPVGSYVIVQDTPVDALETVMEFVAANPDWKIDRSRERFALTNTLMGYLKRVR